VTERKLHPRIRVLWLFQAVLLAGILSSIAFAATAVLDAPEWIAFAVGGVVLLLAGTHAFLRYRRWSFEIREDALYLERGVITQVRTVVPLVRIQHVDSSRGPTERIAGLASCVVYTAGSRGADVRIPGLSPGDADDLRERLKRLAIRAEGEDAV
jgi:membrane protein YdbS with pleckstrin-like domain